MPIAYQRQPTKKTCGQTCLAMVLGKTPKWVIADMLGWNKATSAELLAHFLKKNGVDCPEELVPVQPGQALPELAICQLSWPRKNGKGKTFRRNWHWVVRADGRFYDPLHPEYVDGFPRGVVTAVLPLTKE